MQLEDISHTLRISLQNCTNKNKGHHKRVPILKGYLGPHLRFGMVKDEYNILSYFLSHLISSRWFLQSFLKRQQRAFHTEAQYEVARKVYKIKLIENLRSRSVCKSTLAKLEYKIGLFNKLGIIVPITSNVFNEYIIIIIV